MRDTSFISGPTGVEDDPKASFSIATTPSCRRRHYSFPCICSTSISLSFSFSLSLSLSLYIYIYIYISHEVRQPNRPTCRICHLHLRRSITPHQRVSCIWHKAEFDGEVFSCEVWSNSSFPLLPGPLWPGVVVCVRVLCMHQIKLFDNYLCANKWYIKLNC